MVALVLNDLGCPSGESFDTGLESTYATKQIYKSEIIWFHSIPPYRINFSQNGFSQQNSTIYLIFQHNK